MPTFDSTSQDFERYLMRGAGGLLRGLVRCLAGRSGLKETVRDFERDNGAATWTHVGDEATADAVAGEMGRRGKPCVAEGPFVVHRWRDAAEVARIAYNLGRDDCYTSPDGDVPALPAPGETGLSWESHLCDSPEVAERLAEIISAEGIDCVAVESSVRYRSEDADRIIGLLQRRGFRIVDAEEADIDVGRAAREDGRAAAPREATPRQRELISKLRDEGTVSEAEYAAFERSGTFSAARDLLNRRAGYSIDEDRRRAASRPKDTDRDGFADVAEDFDSDGIDDRHEAMPANPESAPNVARSEERLPELERECTAAARVDQPGSRGRSEIYKGPESR